MCLVDLNAKTIKSLTNYSLAACAKWKITDVNTIADVKAEAVLQALVALTLYDPQRDVLKRGRGAFARFRGSCAAKLAARKYVELQRRERTGLDLDV